MANRLKIWVGCQRASGLLNNKTDGSNIAIRRLFILLVVMRQLFNLFSAKGYLNADDLSGRGQS